MAAGVNPGKRIPVNCMHSRQTYTRALPRGSGDWLCDACGVNRNEKRIQDPNKPCGFTPQEVRSLDALRHLMSNDWYGDLFKHERVVACMIPGWVVDYHPRRTRWVYQPPSLQP